MLRIIDMSSVNDTPGAFAVWDTVTDSFVSDNAGEQCWDSVDEIDGLDHFIERIRGIVPVVELTATEVNERWPRERSAVKQEFTPIWNGVDDA